MTKILYELVYIISKIHNYLLRLNDSYELYFDDKQLHFFVIGLVGMAITLFVYPIFKYLINRKRYLTITWIYSFTLIVVIAFAIEIGQKITNTGNMEFGDIMYGVTGFFAMFLCYAFVVGLFRLVVKLIKGDDEE